MQLRNVWRIAAGLIAGVIGGAATRAVAAQFEFLPPGAADVAFWAVVIGGLYKGYAAALRATDHVH